MYFAARRIKSSAVNFENQRLLKSMTVFCGIENLEDLGFVGFGVLRDLFGRQRRAGHGAAGGSPIMPVKSPIRKITVWPRS